jgi:hypothetical protein
MKTTTFLGCLLLLTGCSLFRSADDDNKAPSTPNAPPPLRGIPAPEELTEKFGVFVTENGDDVGDGSRVHPFKTFRAAIAAAKETKKRVYACNGNYAEAIEMADGVSMVGGFDCHDSAAWTATTSDRPHVAPPTSSAGVIAKHITTETRLEGFEIAMPDAQAAGESSIGLLAVDATGLTVARTRIVAGNAKPGADGAVAIQLVPSSNGIGVDGLQQFFDGNKIGHSKPSGAAGGSITCTGASGHDPETGGRGGSAGLYSAYCNDEFGNVCSWAPYANIASNGADPGEVRDGAPGGNGADGASALTIGKVTELGFTPSDGAPGSNGSPGHGGRGGDGLGPPSTRPNDVIGQTWVANGGGGGGAGGCPGLAHGAGHGGGASLAAVVIGQGVTFDHSELVANSGGDGGRGGFGSDATYGGGPGRSYGILQALPGGRGGDAGMSGHGAGGPSVAIAISEMPGPKLVETTTRAGKPGAGVPATSNGSRTIAASPAGVATDTALLQ